MVITRLSNKAMKRTAHKLISQLVDELDYYTSNPHDFRYEEVASRRDALIDMLRLLRDIKADTESQRARSNATYASRQARFAKEKIIEQADAVSRTQEDVRILREKRMVREGERFRRMMSRDGRLR